MLFISYAINDGAEYAQRLVESLTDRGYRTWLDRQDVDPSKGWDHAVDSGIGVFSWRSWPA